MKQLVCRDVQPSFVLFLLSIGLMACQPVAAQTDTLKVASFNILQGGTGGGQSLTKTRDVIVASGADVVGFDPGLLRVYVACGSGAISIFQEDDADHYHKVQDFPVQKRVHSLVVDRKTHRVYAPEELEDELRGIAACKLILNPISPVGNPCCNCKT